MRPFETLNFIYLAFYEQFKRGNGSGIVWRH